MKSCLSVLFSIFLLLAFLVFSMGRCSPSAAKPSDQTYTKWASEDGNFVLYVDGDGQTFGTISNNGNQEHVRITWRNGVELFVKPIKVYDGENFYFPWDNVRSMEGTGERWRYKYSSSSRKNNKFEIEVGTMFESRYFEMGQKIVLWRVAENLAPEEIEYPPIMLPDYYYLYEKYKDLLDWKLKTTDEVVEKYGLLDIYNGNYIDRDVVCYIVETDEFDNPKYLIHTTVSRNGVIVATLVTPDSMKEWFGIQ